MKRGFGSCLGALICCISLGILMPSTPSFAGCDDPPKHPQKIQQNYAPAKTHSKSQSQLEPQEPKIDLPGFPKLIMLAANDVNTNPISGPSSNPAASNSSASTSAASTTAVSNTPVSNTPASNAPATNAATSNASTPTAVAPTAAVPPNAAPPTSAAQNAQTAKPAAETGQPIGQVVWVKGVVKVIISEKNKTERALERRSPIYVHDTIVTDKTSSGQVVFSDNSMVSLSSNTVFRVDDYAYGKDVPAEKAKYVATLVKGGFRTITGFIPKQNHQNYKVKTPVATIAVQGTEYRVSHDMRTVVGWISGSPTVTSGGRTIVLSPTDRYTAVPSMTAPPQKLVTPPAEFHRAIQMVPSHFEPQQMNMKGVPAAAAAGAAAGTTQPPPPGGGKPSEGAPTGQAGGTSTGPGAKGEGTGKQEVTGGKSKEVPAGKVSNNSFCIQ